MKRKFQVFTFIILVFSPSFYPSLLCQERPNTSAIAGYFDEIKQNTARFKQLWDLDLYGPVLLVDPESLLTFSNMPDSAGVLKKTGDIWTGYFPKDLSVANTAMKWNGRTWAMIMLPLPENKKERLDLLSHELFHRSQPTLGFVMYNPANNHLDNKDGRVLLRLELEALGQAISSSSPVEAGRHVANALYFRNQRYKLYPDARKNENLLELNEGLAAYTGIAMSTRNDSELKEYFKSRISGLTANPSFVRSFAYLTTPLYGTILSASDRYWNRKTGKDTNLTDFFTSAFNLKVPESIDSTTIRIYNSTAIIAEERKREEKVNLMKEGYRKLFVDQPHLEIKLERMSLSFDPRGLMPLEGLGTVYMGLRIADTWGILSVSGGALLGSGWDRVTVSVPKVTGDKKVSGEGWVLELNEGFFVEKNKSDQNYSVVKKQD
ncbi:MAG: hypothetical protein U0X39_05925 [Bacteroidales bacterium]